MKPDFTKIKALLKEGTKGKWDNSDISPSYIHRPEMKDIVVYGNSWNDAALIVELRNQIEGIMEYCEGLEKINEVTKE